MKDEDYFLHVFIIQYLVDRAACVWNSFYPSTEHLDIIALIRLTPSTL